QQTPKAPAPVSEPLQTAAAPGGPRAALQAPKSARRSRLLRAPPTPHSPLPVPADRQPRLVETAAGPEARSPGPLPDWIPSFRSPPARPATPPKPPRTPLGSASQRLAAAEIQFHGARPPPSNSFF